MMLGTLIVLVGALLRCKASFPVSSAMRSFGHSIKNGKLTAYEETAIFEHKCSVPPCTVTQMHCPTAGPTDWYNSVLRLYVDGEPGLDLTLGELANLGFPGRSSGGIDRRTADESPWGTSLFGHLARRGGVFTTVRIPFGTTLRITITSKVNGLFWFIVRGVECFPVLLGDLLLPHSARLRLHRTDRETAPLELVTIADVPRGIAGALVTVKFDGDSSDYKYLEGCVRALVDGETRPIYLSSGVEDYFLSAYFFEEGMYKTPTAGLTFFDDHGSLSAYKTHDRDPFLWNDGVRLIFRNGEDMARQHPCGDSVDYCPQQFCPIGENKTYITEHKASHATGKEHAQEYSPTDFKLLVWTYEWPMNATGNLGHDSAQSSDAVDVTALRYIASLGAAGLIQLDIEKLLIGALVNGDVRVASVTTTYSEAALGLVNPKDERRVLDERAAMVLTALASEL